MSGVADIQYVVTVSGADGSTKAVQLFDDAIKNTGKSTEETERRGAGMWKQMAGGAFIADATMKAVNALNKIISSSKEEFLAAEAANNQLNATLKNMGVYSDENISVLDDYARAMQKATTVDDDTSKSLMALGMRMGISIDQIREATKSAIGLSKSFDIDLQSAMKMVSLATEGEFAMMGRYIPQLRTAETMTQKMAIATKVMGEGFKIAEAEILTTGGQLQQTKNKINDTKESIGALTVKLENMVLKAAKPAVQILADLADAFGDVLDQANRADITKRWEADMKGLEAALKGTNLTTNQYLSTLGRSKAEFEMNAKGALNLSNVLGDLIIKNPKAARAFKEYTDSQRQASAGNSALSLSTSAVTKELDRLRKEEDDRRAASKKATDQQEKERQSAARLAITLANIKDADVDLANTNTSILEPSIEGIVGELINTDEHLLKIGNDAKKSFAYMISAAVDAWQKYGETAMAVINGVDAVFSQSIKNKEITLENAYKQEVERIENSKMNEEEKAAAIEKLDSEYDEKRKALKLKQANQDKLMSIVQATINTFEAATKAYATGGPIFGPILAGIITALGLALVAKIKSQPIALAKGAIFNRPTLIPMIGGGAAEVAERGEPEVVATPRNIRKAIGLDGGGGGSQNIILQVRILIDGREMKNFIAEAVREKAGTGDLVLPGKVIQR